MHRIARDKLTRHQELKDRHLISQSLLDEVIAQANSTAIVLEDHERRLADLPNRVAMQRAQVAKAQALADRAGLELSKTGIRAPFDGPVLAVNVAPGDRSSLGVNMIELADADGFEVRVQVPDQYERRFQRHLDGGGSIDATLVDGRPLTLARLARRVRPGQSGLDAFFRFATDVHAAGLPPIGRIVDLRVRLPEELDVVALPIASLYENDRVYAVDGNRLRAIDVERVGELHTAEGEYRVLVRSPELTAGRSVITTQLPKAVSGLLVEPS
jgi:multidrug efflux pump subunit AcrA (membrane-fusion protein)